MPSLPASPSLPSLPSEPSLPSLPSEPSEPSLPSLPASPSLPSLPSEPSEPSLPSSPFSPDSPFSPFSPDSPFSPFSPFSPGLWSSLGSVSGGVLGLSSSLDLSSSFSTTPGGSGIGFGNEGSVGSGAGALGLPGPVLGPVLGPPGPVLGPPGPVPGPVPGPGVGSGLSGLGRFLFASSSAASSSEAHCRRQVTRRRSASPRSLIMTLRLSICLLTGSAKKEQSTPKAPPLTCPFVASATDELWSTVSARPPISVEWERMRSVSTLRSGLAIVDQRPSEPRVSSRLSRYPRIRPTLSP